MASSRFGASARWLLLLLLGSSSLARSRTSMAARRLHADSARRRDCAIAFPSASRSPRLSRTQSSGRSASCSRTKDRSVRRVVMEWLSSLYSPTVNSVRPDIFASVRDSFLSMIPRARS